MIRSLCIFCGSRHGAMPAYRDQAARLGTLCAQLGVEMVYGGGHVGLMGVAADAAMTAGGKVTGLIPRQLLEREVGHDAISELIVTDSMSDRKDRMIARSDAFAVLPGGLGTLDELFEVLTLRQLGYHRKPTVLVNVDGFWDPLTTLIRRAVDGGFADPDVYPMMRVVKDADGAMRALGIGDGTPRTRAVS